MTMRSLTGMAAAGAVALSLVGCGGSFVPATTGQSGLSASHVAGGTVTTDAAPGSVSAHPAGSTPPPRTNESISSHPTYPTDDESTPPPTPKPTAKAAALRSRSRESVSAHPSAVAPDNGTPAPGGTTPPSAQ